MAKILVLGLCPLPFENTKKNFGPGIRAWQFIQPLLQSRHSVLLIANRIPFIYPEGTLPEIKTCVDSLTYINVADKVFQNQQRIQDLHDSFQPDVILAVTILWERTLPQKYKRKST